MKFANVVDHSLLEKDINGRDVMREIWRILWTSNASPRVKLFIWRVIHNIMPIALAFQTRGVNIENNWFVVYLMILCTIFSLIALLQL